MGLGVAAGCEHGQAGRAPLAQTETRHETPPRRLDAVPRDTHSPQPPRDSEARDSDSAARVHVHCEEQESVHVHCEEAERVQYTCEEAERVHVHCKEEASVHVHCTEEEGVHVCGCPAKRVTAAPSSPPSASEARPAQTRGFRPKSKTRTSLAV
eukprot:3567851-Rhodomonas_salina.1